MHVQTVAQESPIPCLFERKTKYRKNQRRALWHQRALPSISDKFTLTQASQILQAPLQMCTFRPQDPLLQPVQTRSSTSSTLAVAEISPEIDRNALNLDTLKEKIYLWNQNANSPVSPTAAVLPIAVQNIMGIEAGAYKDDPQA